MSKWTRGSRRKRRRMSSKGVKGTTIKVGTVGEYDKVPQSAGKRKVVRVMTAGEKAAN